MASHSIHNNYEYHLPGHNYIGPGTNIVKNILNNKPPMDQADAAAMLHDVEYLMYAGEDAVPSDLRAMYNSGIGLDALALQLGLSIRAISGLKYNVADEDLDAYNTRKLGFALQQYMVNNNYWKTIIEKYDLQWTEQPRLPIEEQFIDDWLNL